MVSRSFKVTLKCKKSNCKNLNILNDAKANHAVPVSQDKSAWKGANCIKPLLQPPHHSLCWCVSGHPWLRESSVRVDSCGRPLTHLHSCLSRHPVCTVLGQDTAHFPPAHTFPAWHMLALNQSLYSPAWMKCDFCSKAFASKLGI